MRERRTGRPRGVRRQGRGAAEAQAKPRGERREKGARKGASAPRFEHVDLRIHSIKCVDDSKEIDRDEITLAAIKVEGKMQGSGNAKKLAVKAEKGETLDGGKFKKGDMRKYSQPRRVARFAAGGEGAKDDWPRQYHATLVLIVKDKAAIGAIVNKIVTLIEKQLAGKIVATVGKTAANLAAGAAAGAAMGSAVPLVGTAAGAAVGAAIKAGAGAIKKAREDDVFEPKQVRLELPAFPSDAGEIEGSKDKKVFKGFKGRYDVTYSWAVQ